MNQSNVLLGGELGDAIYAMPTVRAVGNSRLFVTNRPLYRPDWVRRSASLVRLFDKQGYIASFQEWAGEKIDLDLTTFRSGGHIFGRTIADKIARWARVAIDKDTPWISCEGSSYTHGRIVVSRGERWRGFYFPWRELVASHGNDMLFIGTDAEYADFCKFYGRVERLACRDMLDVAEAIRGCELFIGNQSSPFSLCESMKHPAILEVAPYACDCYYGRQNCTYVVDGGFKTSVLGDDLSFEPFKRDLGCEKGFTPDRIKECVIRAGFVVRGEVPPSVSEIQSQITLAK